jgi:hypothetical protein
VGSSDEIVELAKRSGISYRVGSTHRPGAVTRSGSRSYHATDDAVDFTGANQDALAQWFIANVPTYEVIHHSNRTGRNYATSGGRPFTLSGQLLEDHRDHLHVAASEAKARDVLGGRLGGFITGLGAGLGATGLPFPTPGTVTEGLANVGQAIENSARSAAEIAGLANQVGKLFLPSNLIRGFALFFGSIFILIGILFLAREVRQSAP